MTALSFVAALLLGMVIASFRVSPIPPLRLVGAVYVEVFRNTPLLAQFVLFFFGLTKLGIQFPPFQTAVIVLALYTAAFTAETIRSGINSVSAGQAEAARSLGLSFRQTLSTVVLPQSFRTVVAPLGSLLIALTKNSSLASVIAATDLMFYAEQINNDTSQYLPAFLGVGVAYLILTYPMGLLVGVLERKVAIKR